MHETMKEFLVGEALEEFSSPKSFLRGKCTTFNQI